MRFLKLSAFIFLLASIFWTILPHDKLPSILFPKGAQHNTFGELPIVEIADDGVFSEIDGEEYADIRKRKIESCLGVVKKSCDFYDNKTRIEINKVQNEYKKCINMSYTKDGKPIFDSEGFHLSDQCGVKPPVFDTKEKCVEKVIRLCEDYGGEVRCGDLDNFGVGLFTCLVTFR